MGKPSAATAEPGSVRIIAGAMRSRRLHFPARPGLRPTGDRVRETLFNWLQNSIAGARCLDLFAGSGALAVEALSRGATHADLVDNDHQVAVSLRQVAQELGLDNARIHQLGAEDFIARHAGQVEPYHIVFLDPPFAAGLLPGICAQLDTSGLLARKSLIYLENEEPLEAVALPPSWQQLRSKKSGQVYYYLYEAA